MKELVDLYRKKYGKEPDEKALHEFFWLFTDGDDILPECWENTMRLCGNYELTKKRFNNNQKKYKDMSSFLENI